MGMFSSLFGDGGAAERAANVAAAAQQQAGDLINSRYNDVKANYQPYMDAGTAALGSYQNIANGIAGQVNPIINQMGTTVNSMNPIVGQLTSSNLNDYQESPGYDFRMQQGEKAIQNSAAATGTLDSGATLKALEQYGQDYGTNDYQTYLGNLQNQLTAVNTQLGAQGNYLNSTINGADASLNAYSPLISTGYNAANASAQTGMQAAAQQGSYIAGAGATTASGMQATANSLANAGQNWINIGSAVAGAATGMPTGALTSGMTTASSTPPASSNYIQPMPYSNTSTTASAQPYNPGNYATAAPQAMLPTSSGALYNPNQMTSNFNPWSR